MTIIFQIITSGQNMDIQSDGPCEYPLPAISCQLMRLAAAARRILLQEVITWPVLCELIVMDLDPTFLICHSLTAPAVSKPEAEGLAGETFAQIERKREEVSPREAYTRIFGTAHFSSHCPRTRANQGRRSYLAAVCFRLAL